MLVECPLHLITAAFAGIGGLLPSSRKAGGISCIERTTSDASSTLESLRKSQKLGRIPSFLAMTMGTKCRGHSTSTISSFRRQQEPIVTDSRPEMPLSRHRIRRDHLHTATLTRSSTLSVRLHIWSMRSWESAFKRAGHAKRTSRIAWTRCLFSAKGLSKGEVDVGRRQVRAPSDGVLPIGPERCSAGRSISVDGR